MYELSEKRARTIGNYLIKMKVKTKIKYYLKDGDLKNQNILIRPH